MTAAETSRDVRAVVAEPRDGGASSRLADDAVLVPDAGGVGRWWRHYCFLLSTHNFLKSVAAADLFFGEDRKAFCRMD